MKACKIMSDNNKYPRLKAIKREGMRKIFIINSSVPSSKFIMLLSKLNNSLNTNIIHISLENKSLLVFTEKNGEINPELKRQSKFYSLFEQLELEIKIKDYEDTDFYTKLYFDTEVYYNKLQSLIQEFRHRLKVDNLELTTHNIHNYCLSTKKIVNYPSTFIEAYKANIETINKKIIPVMLGINTELGAIEIIDMMEMIHLIVAGSTGQGKSIMLHNIISSIQLAKRKNIRSILCDPKKNELKIYRNLYNVIYANTNDSILDELKKLVAEMDRRNNLFEPYDFISNIEDYNNKHDSKLEYIVCVIDEIADLILKSDKEFEIYFVNALNRLTQLGRSVGIRMILTTQKPTVKVLPDFIKANCLDRICFGVSNKTESRTVLDNNLAASINQIGKYVFQHKKSNVMYRSFFISEGEKKSIINMLKPQYEKKGARCENNLVTLEKSNFNGGVRGGAEESKGVRIKTAYNLYKFYINNQKNDGELPTRKEVIKLTGLTNWDLRAFHIQLKSEGKLMLDKNKLYIVNNVDELANKRSPQH